MEPLISNVTRYSGPMHFDPFGGATNVAFFDSLDDPRAVVENIRFAADIARRLGDFYTFYSTLPPLPDFLVAPIPGTRIPVANITDTTFLPAASVYGKNVTQ